MKNQDSFLAIPGFVSTYPAIFREQWAQLHQEMETAIAACRRPDIPELEQVEAAFRIAGNYWERVKARLQEYAFACQEEEIDFYRNIKPRFTCYIEYLTLVNHALLFVPGQDNKEFEADYWAHELKRLDRFRDKNKAFVAYYKKGDTRHDLQYFLPANYDLGNYIVSKPYDLDGEFLSSHDHLVAILLAQEMYHEYVKKKLTCL